MVKNHDAYKGVKVHHMVSNGPGEYVKPEYAENFFTEVWFGAGNSRKAIAAGNGDIVPVYFYEIPILMRKGLINVDVLLLQVTPPDKYGKVSTGIAADYTVQALRSARTVIAQVNNNVPFQDVQGIMEGTMGMLSSITGVDSKGLADVENDVTATAVNYTAKVFQNNIRHFCNYF